MGFHVLGWGDLCACQVLQKLKRRIDADSHVYETRKGEGHIMHTNTCFWRMFCYVTVWMQVLTSPACVINVLTFSHSITPAQTLTGEAREKGAKVIYTPIIADVTRQYARHGSADSVCRIFAILTLQRLMGRLAETKCLCIDAIRWDVFRWDVQVLLSSHLRPKQTNQKWQCSWRVQPLVVLAWSPRRHTRVHSQSQSVQPRQGDLVAAEPSICETR